MGKDISMITDCYFGDENGIHRDSLGHTACVSCGHVVSRKVEQYSLKSLGKVLCFNCQKKYINSNGTTKTD